MAKKPIRIFKKVDGKIAGEIVSKPSPENIEPAPVPCENVEAEDQAIVQPANDAPMEAEKARGAAGVSQYEDLLNSIYDAVLIVDMDGSILEVNNRAEHNLARAKEDLCKMNILDVVSGADERLLDLIRKNTSVQKFTVMEAVCITGSDSRFSGEIVVSRMRGSRPNLIFFIRDITKRKKAEEQLRNASEQLISAEKTQARMEALSALFYEMNNPLQILTCMAEIDKNGEYKKQIERVVSVLDELRKKEATETAKGENGGEARGGSSTEITGHKPCDPKSLMIVDDEKVLRDMFVNALSLTFSGISVVTAADGQEAVRVFTEKRPSVIIMDVSMPMMSGDAAYLEIKAECERQGLMVPSVIFCTGFVINDAIAEIVGDGSVNQCLEKPLKMASLINAVKKSLKLDELPAVT